MNGLGENAGQEVCVLKRTMDLKGDFVRLCHVGIVFSESSAFLGSNILSHISIAFCGNE